MAAWTTTQMLAPQLSGDPQTKPALRRQALGLVVLLLLIAGAIAAAAALSFPQDADGYLLLLLKEKGPEAILAGHPDRPLVAQLWWSLARAAGDLFWPLAFVLHLALWTTFGLQAAALWRHFFPEWRRHSALVACLTVCPIVVRVQFSVVTVTLLGLLSAVLTYGAFFLFLRYTVRGGAAWLGAGIGLVAVGVLISEYGVASAGAPVVLLASLGWSGGDRARRSRAALSTGALAATALVFYVVYQLTRDRAFRSDVDPAFPFRQGNPLLVLPLALATRVWHVLVGAYASVAGALRVEWSSKSSILAIVSGCVVAVVLSRSVGDSGSAGVPRVRRCLVLFLAVMAGLAPVALMRPTSLIDYASRFSIPVLPAATALTVCLALAAFRGGFRRAAMGLLGLIAGASVVFGSAEALHRRRALADIGDLLRPEVARTGTYTVAVIPSEALCWRDVLCTAGVSARWPAELVGRLWIYDAATARARIGPRRECPSRLVLNEDYRGIRRSGPVGQIFWVESRSRSFELEPYCVAPMVAYGPTAKRRALSGRFE